MELCCSLIRWSTGNHEGGSHSANQSTQLRAPFFRNGLWALACASTRARFFIDELCCSPIRWSTAHHEGGSHLANQSTKLRASFFRNGPWALACASTWARFFIDELCCSPIRWSTAHHEGGVALGESIDKIARLFFSKWCVGSGLCQYLGWIFHR